MERLVGIVEIKDVSAVGRQLIVMAAQQVDPNKTKEVIAKLEELLPPGLETFITRMHADVYGEMAPNALDNVRGIAEVLAEELSEMREVDAQLYIQAALENED